MARKFSEVQHNLADYISLSKLFNRKVVDVVVHISMEFGDPILKIDKIEFEGGDFVHVGGEHDIAYIETWNNDLQYSQEEIEAIYDEVNDDRGD